MCCIPYSKCFLQEGLLDWSPSSEFSSYLESPLNGTSSETSAVRAHSRARPIFVRDLLQQTLRTKPVFSSQRLEILCKSV